MDRALGLLGFLLYPAPILGCSVLGVLIARVLSRLLKPKLQNFPTAALISIATLSAILAIILAFVITFIGLIALAMSLLIPTEQVTAQIPGYTITFYQETDLEYTTLALELHREDGFVAHETIDSDFRNICQKLRIEREGERLRLVCDRTGLSGPFSLNAYIDPKQTMIFIDSRWHKEHQIPFDQLYFYRP